MLMNYKVCTSCNRKLEAVKENFHTSKDCKFGLTSRCKDCTKEYRRLFYLENRERMNLRNRQYHKKNKTKIKEYQKQYYINNKEVLSAKSKKYYWDNKENK